MSLQYKPGIRVDKFEITKWVRTNTMKTHSTAPTGDAIQTQTSLPKKHKQSRKAISSPPKSSLEVEIFLLNCGIKHSAKRIVITSS